MTVMTARLDERGRLALPAELRHRMGVAPGDDLVLIEEPAENGEVVRMEGRKAAAHGLIGIAGKARRPAVEQLRERRREEAAGESGDACRPRT